MYCTRCGNTLADSASFCGACGQATNATSAMVPQKQLEPPLTLPVVLPYAGFWRRFVAYLIDGMMTLAVIEGLSESLYLLCEGSAYFGKLARGCAEAIRGLKEVL